MNRKLLVFNIFYYSIIILLITRLTSSGGVALGYMILLMIFWGVAMIFLIILLATKAINLRSAMDKVGVFLATPVISIVFLVFFSPSQGVEPLCKEVYFEQNNRRYLKKTCENNGRGKIIEYYLSFDSVSNETNRSIEVILKDSTWVYLSQNGDTVKTVKYKNDVEVK